MLKELAEATTLESFFSGQSIMKAGELEDTFMVLRRGKVEVVLGDGSILDTAWPGAGFGELGMLFGTRRNATVRCAGPCEVIVLDRASFQTQLSKLPEDKRVGRLEKILLKFWDLVAAADAQFNRGCAKQTSVGFQSYRALHIRAAKSLTKAEQEAEYDEDEHRKIAGSDWTEDCHRCEWKLPSSSVAVFVQKLTHTALISRRQHQGGWKTFYDHVL